MARKDGSTLVKQDPNSDLIGYRFDSEDGVLAIVGSADWANELHPQWMKCENDKIKTLRSTSLLRYTRDTLTKGRRKNG